MQIIISLSVISSISLIMSAYLFFSLRKSEGKLISQENYYFVESQQNKLQMEKLNEQIEYQKRLVGKYQRLNNKMSLKIDLLIDKRYKLSNPTPAKNKKQITFN